MDSKLKNSGIEWVGQIPQSWEIVPIKTLLKKKKRILETWTDENVLSLTMNGVIVRDLLNPKGKMPATFDGYQTIDKGNFILCLFDIDVTPRCVGVANDAGITSPAYSQYITKWGITQYYYYLLLMMDNDKVLLPYSKTLRSTLTDEYFGAVKVPITSDIREQQAIAYFLDEKVAKIDAIIADTKLSIEKLKAYKQSLITEAVTKGLDPNIKMKDSGVEWIGKVPEGWSVNRIKYISMLRGEKGKYKNGDKFLALEKMKPFTPGYMSLNSIVDEGTQMIIRNGDVLFSKLRPFLGKVALSNFDGFGTGELLAYKNVKINPKFFMYKFISEQILQPINASMYGTKMPRANSDFIKSLPISYPSNDEQAEIVKGLDAKILGIDGLISEKESLISRYEDYKKSLIYEYVTGKKRVE